MKIKRLGPHGLAEVTGNGEPFVFKPESIVEIYLDENDDKEEFVMIVTMHYGEKLNWTLTDTSVEEVIKALRIYFGNDEPETNARELEL